MFHFYVCPKPAYCSCIRRGLEACLHILLSILDFLWRELFSDFSLWFAPLMGLGFIWLWVFLSSAHSFAPFCSLAFPTALFCYSYCDVIWTKSAGPLWVCYLFFSQWLSMIIGLLLHGLWAPASHLFPFGCPWPIYFPWASSALSNFASSWTFTNSFGFLRPNYFILHPWGSWARHQPLTFFDCIILGLLWLILTLLHHTLPMSLLIFSLRAP